jgi:uncharacterized membrane protein
MAQDPIAALRAEISELNRRVAALEQLLRAHAPPAAPPKPEREGEPVSRPAPSAPSDAGELEAEIGGNWLNKIGAAALVLAIAFFLKYSFDSGWINETGRIIIGILVGLLCLYGGEYFQAKGFAKYAQGISGAGIAILYFTIYAAFSFYRLIPQLPAFAFMVVVTAAAIAISVRYDALSIAVLGIIGGFFTPVLLEGGAGAGGGGSQIQLLAYIAVLDLGILGVTRYKGWRSLNVLSLVGTVLIVLGWMLSYYTSSRLGVTMAFLTVFYLIFAAQSLVQNVVVRRPLTSADILLAVAAPALYFSASYSLLDARYQMFLGLFAVVMAAIYLPLSHRVFRAGFEDRRLCLLYLCVATAFLTIAVPIQLSRFWITIGWTVEAAAFGLIGFYLKSQRTRYVALGLLVLASYRLFVVDFEMFYLTRPIPVFNERFLTFLIVAAAAVVLAWLYNRNRAEIEDRERSFCAVLVLFANFVMIWAISAEALAYVDLGGRATESLRSLTLSAVWLVYGFLMLAAGINWRHRPARLMGVAILGLVIAKSFLYDVWMLDRLTRIVAFVALGVMLLVASYIYQRYGDRVRQIVSRGDEADEQ